MHSILRHNMENANVKTALSIAGLIPTTLACHNVHEEFYQRSRLSVKELVIQNISKVQKSVAFISPALCIISILDCNYALRLFLRQ